jgi:hypothetical protein
MACDQELAERIRRLIGSDPDLTEMSGGLAFLIRGNMAIAASSQGGAMVRAGPRQSAALVAGVCSEGDGDARPANAGWLHVSSDDLRTDDDLAAWADRGAGYVRSLPPKQ